MKGHNLFSALLFCLCLFPLMSIAQTATLQPEQISEGDTTVLVIEIEGNTPSLHSVDTTALEGDFEILGTSSSVQVTQSQNKIIKKTRWEIELFPLKTGKLDIPSLEINGELTPKLVLDVKKYTGAQGVAANQGVFIKMSAEPEHAYIGQQINIVIKLFHNIRIVNGTLSEPEAVNADIYRIGNDISYVQTIEGVRYNVLERTFALFTNAPGEIQILPVSFRGQIETQNDDESSFSSFMRQVKQIKRAGNELRLNIKDIPSSFTGKVWLPANDLRISEQYSDTATELKIGDSVNRSIKILADGLPAESLPQDLFVTENDLINIYPDKVSRSNQDIGKKLVGKLEQKFALILPKAGYVTIPELKLKWWDIDEQVEKEAVLPERVLIVGNSADGQVSAPMPDNQAQTMTSMDNVRTITGQRPPQSINFWRWIALGLFIIWLLTLYQWKKSAVGIESEEEHRVTDNSFKRKRLQMACKENDPYSCRNELIAWAKQRWPDKSISGLHGLRDQVASTALHDQLAELDQALFSNHPSHWNGDALWHAFLQENTSQGEDSTETEKPQIPPLYSH